MYIFLLFDDFADSGIVEAWVDVALHHGASFIVLDVALPSLRGHTIILGEALLTEIPQGKIISVGH